MSKIKIFFLILFFILALPVGASEVTNNISVSANTGGNIAGSGQVIERQPLSILRERTVIDGKVIEDVTKVATGTGKSLVVKTILRSGQRSDQSEVLSSHQTEDIAKTATDLSRPQLSGQSEKIAKARSEVQLRVLESVSRREFEATAGQNGNWFVENLSRAISKFIHVLEKI